MAQTQSRDSGTGALIPRFLAQEPPRPLGSRLFRSGAPHPSSLIRPENESSPSDEIPSPRRPDFVCKGAGIRKNSPRPHPGTAARSPRVNAARRPRGLRPAKAARDAIERLQGRGARRGHIPAQQRRSPRVNAACEGRARRCRASARARGSPRPHPGAAASLAAGQRRLRRPAQPRDRGSFREQKGIDLKLPSQPARLRKGEGELGRRGEVNWTEGAPRSRRLAAADCATTKNTAKCVVMLPSCRPARISRAAHAPWPRPSHWTSSAIRSLPSERP
nr:uncharacterized protein LOC127296012 [Lolium perenne]